MKMGEACQAISPFETRAPSANLDQARPQRRGLLTDTQPDKMAAPDPSRGEPNQSRRGQGRRLLLESARELFATKSYMDVTTKEIAEHAGVTEPILFRHFGSKHGLLQEAVFEPFSNALNEFIEDWENRPPGVRDPLDEARDVYRGWYTALTNNRGLVKALIAAETLQGANREPAGPPLGRILKRFEKLTTSETRIRHYRPFDPTALTHIMFGMVLAVAIHGEWMRAGIDGPTPNADDYIEEMALLTIYGLAKPKRDTRRTTH
jgi:AcrR family transcriptional regulator